MHSSYQIESNYVLDLWTISWETKA
jgi:hypothetical protein